MTPHATCHAHSPRLSANLPRGLAARTAALLALWRHRAHTRRALATLDAARLADIGLTEAEARAESSKPFWRA